MTGAQSDMRIDGLPEAARRTNRRSEWSVRFVSPGPDLIPSGWLHDTLEALLSEPEHIVRSFHDHTELVLILATGKSRSVRCRTHLDEKDRGAGKLRNLMHQSTLTRPGCRARPIARSSSSVQSREPGRPDDSRHRGAPRRSRSPLQYGDRWRTCLAHRTEDSTSCSAFRTARW
jgi:hypothetical protein